jgi:uncharacterized membrane protein
MNHSHEEHNPVSIWPILLAAGVSLLLAGVVYSPVVSIIGLVVLLASIFGWTQENRIMEPQEVEADEDDEARHG